MNSWKVALIDQTDGSVVPMASLQQYQAALQQQVNMDLLPVWGVRANISVLAAGDEVPPGTWPIKIVDSLDDNAGGVHLDDQGQPYAEAVNGAQLSIAISHELLEMLVDPWGNRFSEAADIDPNSDGHQVFYLVEVCDPCETTSYPIDGVPVSDFVLPSFYDPNATGPVNFLNDLAGPLPTTISQGCYISWIDPRDMKWHQQQPNGNFVTAAATAGVNPRADRDSVLGDADAQRHDIPAIYGSWPKVVKRLPRPESHPLPS